MCKQVRTLGSVNVSWHSPHLVFKPGLDVPLDVEPGPEAEPRLVVVPVLPPRLDPSPPRELPRPDDKEDDNAAESDDARADDNVPKGPSDSNPGNGRSQ